MERYTFAIKLRDGMHSSFRSKLGDVWPLLTDFLDRNDIHNFSLWSVLDIVFGYCELSDNMTIVDTEQRKAAGFVQSFEGCFDWISEPKQTMQLMYHDYGVIRESKELIRHRVFVTKLKAGCRDEYKKRHDRLILERGNQVNLGPVSNFSIWNAGDYIFGYNEIDTTMERERTTESLEATRNWETKQLEIMDWITNDMDWLTGEYHPAINRIAWHS